MRVDVGDNSDAVERGRSEVSTLSSASTNRMHADEVDIDAELVRRLLRDQFPRWADLPVVPAPATGTVNAIYRLGEDLAVRLPRRAADDLARERHWLPILAPLLPVDVPEPVAVGHPAEGYPFDWMVFRWLRGTNPDPERLAAPWALAERLAEVVHAFRAIDRTHGPLAHRGGPLSVQDEPTREAIAQLHGRIDTDAATAAWEASLRATEWSRAPVWVHADLMPGNLLVRDEQLTGVLDFGTVGLGDPACDLMVAWNLLPASARPTFRAALGVDDDTWLRGRGRALSMSLIALPYYRHSNPTFAANAQHVIREVLADHAGRS